MALAPVPRQLIAPASGIGHAVPADAAVQRKGPIVKLLDPNDPFFRKPLTRLLCCVLPLLWAGIEAWNGAYTWAAAFAAAGLYLAFMLYLRRDAE